MSLPGAPRAADDAASDRILRRMMQLHPKVIDLVLDRMWRILALLDNPQDRMPPVIHIAGTNGKGSTQAMIRAGLESTGARVHAYTSPHLAHFHERIRLAGKLISEPALEGYLDRVYALNGGDPITYFEITTAAALLAFAETPADWTLLEVGMGGRLDATNVVAKPALTVITPVDLDHQGFLGDTLTKIAGEKAGIIKRGVPVVVAPQHAESMDVIEAEAARKGAPVFAHGQHWHVSTENGRLVYQDDNGLLDLPLPRLRGPHQIINAGTAIAALRVLQQPATAAEAAVTRAEWPARMQHLTAGRLVQIAAPCDLWLDGGHNPAAGIVIAETLQGLHDRPIHLVCGMLNTKDAGGYLRALASVADSFTAVAIPDETNTIPADELAATAAAAGLPNASTAPSVEAALVRLAAAHPGERILICGSLYLAGHVLRENAA
ncbi:dihydrofolate synthase / folylpolyglutamate synthase [Ketogulonicigenium robustum]|uniref:Dihydrofolate synthase/folylpolyglutamate synthase n=1 Tax=Ketogulonicigenium robustum TaxID=92947 RepID=A0A1W6NWY2_9RHOB|nr:folylpolyglutamate synthase/dihydrofolate synthase family protein [Ketogulonicigenium robustum]ARO13663.1 dihydrofolate synthase / folylpolyglutamate synthase [Ketogulonicigenium robustum]